MHRLSGFQVRGHVGCRRRTLDARRVAHDLGWSNRHVMTRTSSNSRNVLLARATSTTPAWARRRRWQSTSFAEPYPIRQWCIRFRPDRPWPSERFAGTELAERITWSARHLKGAGTRVTRVIAMVAAWRALRRAMRVLSGSASSRDHLRVVHTLPKLVRRPVSRVAKRPATGRRALDTGRLASYCPHIHERPGGDHGSLQTRRPAHRRCLVPLLPVTAADHLRPR